MRANSALIDHTSWDYRMSQASYYIWRDTLKSKEIFKELLDIEEVGTPNYAMITHSYSRLCHHQKKYDEEKKISDIVGDCRYTECNA